MDTSKRPGYFPDDRTQSYLTLQGSGKTPVAPPPDDWQIGLDDIALSLILNLPVGQFTGTNPVWVISAGPSGTVETGVNSPKLNDPAAGGDDIGKRVK